MVFFSETTHQLQYVFLDDFAIGPIAENDNFDSPIYQEDCMKWMINNGIMIVQPSIKILANMCSTATDSPEFRNVRMSLGKMCRNSDSVLSAIIDSSAVATFYYNIILQSVSDENSSVV